MYTYIYIYIYIHTNKYIYKYVLVCIHICIHIYLHIHLYASICTLTLPPEFACAWIYIYKHIYIYYTYITYICVHLYICIYMYKTEPLKKNVFVIETKTKQSPWKEPYVYATKPAPHKSPMQRNKKRHKNKREPLKGALCIRNQKRALCIRN